MKQSWNEEVWRGLVDSAPDALVVVDQTGKIVYISRQTEVMFGYAPEELINKPIEALLPERYRPSHVGQRDGFFRKPRVRPMGMGLDLFALHKDGSEIPVEISLSPLKTGQGDVVTAAIRNISERKRFEKELKRAREAAESANLAKSEFLANMSHEIRTPLAGIIGYAEMVVLYCSSDEERKAYMDKIRRCADNLTELINDILDLSKVEAGALTVEAVPVTLIPEVEGVLNLLQSRATEKGIGLSAIYERPLPAVIHSDPTRIRQILTNLLGNGIKFTDQGSVTLKVTANDNYLLFSVIDTGCGLSEEEQSRLFQPFVQADTSTTRRYGGTGLGLALSRRLARALGGDLKITQSAPDKGSTFVFALPINAETTAPAKPAAISKPTDEKPDLVGLRVLLAEDNPDNQELIGRFLGAQGIILDVAANGKEALKLAQSNKYAIILMDMQMPVMDGFEATRQLRAAGFKTPIIAVTAHAMNEERTKSLECGCDAFLTKPINVQELLRKMGEFAKK